jgi:hypothetical protein
MDNNEPPLALAPDLVFPDQPKTFSTRECLTDRCYLQEVYLRLCGREDRLFVAVENSGMVHLNYCDAERKRRRSNKGEIIPSDAEHDRLVHESIIAGIMVEALKAYLTAAELAECEVKMRDEVDDESFVDRCIVETEEEFARVRKEMCRPRPYLVHSKPSPETPS